MNPGNKRKRSGFRRSIPAPRRTLLVFCLLLLPPAALFFACDSKPSEPVADNPFDPLNPDTGGDPFNLTAVYQDGGVSLGWNEIAVPGLAGFTLFRMSDRESVFARLDSADADAIQWKDTAPAYFTFSTYRIAAIGASGAESDTAGRGIDTVTVPPHIAVSGGSSVRRREITLRILAEDADSMIVSVDSLLSGATWEAYAEEKPWTLDASFDTITFYAAVMRAGEGPSDTVSNFAAPVRPSGAIELAGGDSIVALSLLDVRVTSGVVDTILISEDTLYGDSGDVIILIDPADSVDKIDTLFQWQFDDTPTAKTLHARFANAFGAETAADTVLPDSLLDVSVVLANGETTTDVCVFTAALHANATLMNYQPGFPADGWEPYDSSFVVILPDTTAGDFIFEVQFSNDFFSTAPVPARDTITFAPRELALVITSPAPPETTITTVSDTTIDTEPEIPDTTITSRQDTSVSYDTFAGGDSIEVEGSLVSQSCVSKPDSVDVVVGDLIGGRVKGGGSWSYTGVIDEGLSDTTVVDVIAAGTDRKGATAADTVAVRIVPAAAEQPSRRTDE